MRSYPPGGEVRTLLLLGLYNIASAGQQAILTWLLRKYVPPTYQALANAALYYGGGLLYLLLVLGLAAGPAGGDWGQLAGQALLVRLLLFDPCLNGGRGWLEHRAGRPATAVFAVGTSVLGDRLLRGLAARLRLHPEHLRALLWLVSAGVGLAWLLGAARG